MTVFDSDGTGPSLPRLYVNAPLPGSTGTLGVSRSDGLQWTSISAGLTSVPFNQGCTSKLESLAAFGTPPPLYGIAVFLGIGPAPAMSFSLVRWNGVTWAGVSLPYLVTTPSLYVCSGGLRLFVADPDGPGTLSPFLGISGMFTTGPNVGLLLSYDGVTFAPIGGINAPVTAAVPFDDNGPGPDPTELIGAGGFNFASGGYVGGMTRWNATSWSPLNGGASLSVEALAVYGEDGSGPLRPALYATGPFSTIGGVSSGRIVRYATPPDIALAFTQPFGPGSIRIANTSCVPGASYFTALTADPLNAVNPGGGTWNGLHIPWADLIGEFFKNAPPFVGSFDAGGGSVLTLFGGVLSGAAGVTVFGITHTYTLSSLALTANSAIAALTIQ
jgi:hypothetical protein